MAAKTKLTSRARITQALAAEDWDFNTRERDVAVPVPGSAGSGFGARADRTVVPGFEITFSGMTDYGPQSGVLRFTAAGAYCADLSSAFGYTTAKFMTLTNVLENIEARSPRRASTVKEQRDSEDAAKAAQEADEIARLTREAKLTHALLQGDLITQLIRLGMTEDNAVIFVTEFMTDTDSTFNQYLRASHHVECISKGDFLYDQPGRQARYGPYEGGEQVSK